jgi:hypothetical protein
VNVNVTTQRVDNVLAVPVNALLALQGGGFGVDVVSGGVEPAGRGHHRRLQQHLVQISGSGSHRRHAGRGALLVTAAHRGQCRP